MAHLLQTKRTSILGLNISQLSFSQALDELVLKAREKQQGYACFVNVHMLVETHKNSKFKAIINKASWVFADGVPLLWTIKKLHKNKQERIAGMDVLPALLAKAEEEQLKVFFYGSSQVVLNKIAQRLMEEYPNLDVVGYFSPPFRELTKKEINQHIALINESKPDLVFVGLGCPKQEKWMYTCSKQISAILLGVGGAFPVFAQIYTRAPKWMQTKGLEWLYRFLQEPKRLWKRYLVTNTIFMILILKELMRRST